MIELPTDYQRQIHKSKYARWDDEKGRRENWNETVDRFIEALDKQANRLHPGVLDEEIEEIRKGILSLEFVPSMRAMMTAGPALERDNISGFNCTYLAIDSPIAFDETLYLLSCGTGVGYSVESRYVSQLPEVPQLHESNITIVVADSKVGWASSLRELIECLYRGDIPSWDLSLVRPKGARLKTFGGRASGPEPLHELFEYVVAVFNDAQGRKLNTRECHGIQCKIADSIVSGGVRRSAMICLSDPDDTLMRDAKTGEWYVDHPEYSLANISAAWEEQPSSEVWQEEWKALENSGSGERGVLSRQNARRKMSKHGRRNPDWAFGTNPCGEIYLRNHGICNLTESIIRPTDTVEDLFRKVKYTTILGTIQSTFTDFRYLNDAWKKNAEEERLLGVSLTGVMTHPILSQPTAHAAAILEALRDYAIEVNKEWADKLGIPQSVAITCVKPSGTVSQLALTHASGLHAAHSEFYIRTNRMNKTDPLAQFLYMQGVPCEDEIFHPDRTWVFSWPMKAPQSSVTRNDLSALEQIKVWMMYSEHWCEHNPSVTISVKPDEWAEVGQFIYDNWDKVGGLSFLPFSDHVYQQAPYQDISEEEYNRLAAEMPDLNWDMLQLYEQDDFTTGSQEYACVGGSCEV